MRRNNQGRGQSGQGQGHGRYQSTNKKSPEIKFYPHGIKQERKDKQQHMQQ